MDYALAITRRLHEEHAATLALWARIEQALGRTPRDARPGDEALDRLLREGAVGLAHEVDQHFAFEETALFPRLAEAGEADIAELLAEEHASIREAAVRFLALQAPSPADADWPELRRLGLELSERLVAHVQKEEMSLLPALEDLIDADTDADLITQYTMN